MNIRFKEIWGPLYLLISCACFAQGPYIILGRPTDKSITASVLFDQNASYFFEYGTQKGQYSAKSKTFEAISKIPIQSELTDLLPNTRYYYRINYKTFAGNNTTGPESYFNTQRFKGIPFTFLVEADEHLYDKKGIVNMYQQTLLNQAKDSADFLISLGDIFGDDHTPNITTSQDMEALHRDYIPFLATVCHSMPFYICLGNHEGENGYYLKQTPPNNIGVYGSLWRKYYYPNPFPNSFYSGNMVTEGYGINLPENYYAWTWGDALFVVLDVYRHVDINEKPQNWDWTLGKFQYDWFKQTLESSKSKYKFVFAHHTRGQGRGGVITAKGYEWGGYSGNTATNYQFDLYRPGWGKPIHQIMIDNKVNIFFQGHDHLFAFEKLDGMVYQEVPMPSDSTYEIGVLANADAYTDIVKDGTGHLRVRVGTENARVEFVRAYLPKDTVRGIHKNREVAYSYTVTGTGTTPQTDILKSGFIALYPNPAKNKIIFNTNEKFRIYNLSIIDLHGRFLYTNLNQTQSILEIDVSHIPTGIYTVRIQDHVNTYLKKVCISR